MAAQNATDKETSDIYQLLTKMEKDYHLGFPQKVGVKDSEFHMLIAKSSHNKILIPLVRAIRELLPNHIHREFWRKKTLVDSAMEYHRKIYEAIAARDPGKARQYMSDHLAMVRDLHKKLLN
jgi:DNA-binding FadR family transcriptional regulator